jgi:UDP-3-O-[3-hydroxymyristoyl] glucosamine N-acyltransferase
MEFSAKQIADILSGDVVGDSNVTVNGLSKIEEGTSGTLSFLSNPKYEEYIYKTGSSICIVNKSFEPTKPLPTTLTLVKVENAYSSFAKLLEFYNQLQIKPAKIEQPSFFSESSKAGEGLYLGAFAYIGENVTLGENVKVYPNAYIGDNVTVGDNTILFPGVKIYANCVIGQNCILHAGVIIGSDGFGFAPNEEGEYQKIPQIGNVILEDSVEVGSNSTIDRATMGSTILRRGVKIDNLVQIAHNVEIGKNTAVAAQAGIAGSAKIGTQVQIGGQAGIAGHLHIADGTQIVAQSGIPNTVKRKAVLMGSPAIDIEDYKKSYFGFRKLPFILKKIQEFDIHIKESKKE